ncbi:MAG: SRPBCC family protein [Chitinophagaceae bacterium]|nr:SRPBCC family protein [Chitinophagaceae bacterium]
MNIFFQILLGIAGLIVLLLIIGLFVRKSFTIERQATINRPVEPVFDYLKYIRNQDDFNPWSQMDPNMQKTYSGTDGTVGFVSAWESNMKRGPGKGEQEIKTIEPNKRLDVELRFLKPFRSVSPAWFVTDPVSADKTKVSWGMYCKFNYPMNLMGVFMNFDKQMGKELDRGLGMLKNNLETVTHS